MGSMSTPPCSQNVLRVVMTTPIQASKEQLEAFDKLFMVKPARMIQEHKNRLIWIGE